MKQEAAQRVCNLRGKDALKSKKFAAGSLPRMTHLHQF